MLRVGSVQETKSVLLIERVTPVYESLPGWEGDISGARTLDDLPENARRYADRVAEIAGIPVRMISVGPERDQAVLV